MEDLHLPWRVIDAPESDFGLVIVNAEESCVAYFAYPGDEEQRTYAEARRNAELICAAVSTIVAAVAVP